MNNHLLDRYDYLRNLVEHYDAIIAAKKCSLFIDIIQQERFKCKHEIDQIRYADATAVLMENVLASVFQD